MGFWQHSWRDRPTPPPMRAWEDSRAAQGLLHRHLDLHRLQGLRGRLQGVEPQSPQDGDLELLGSSYDNTGALGASTWRHVAFIEQDQRPHRRGAGIRPGPGRPRHAGVRDRRPSAEPTATACRAATDLADRARRPHAAPDTPDFRWLMSSDVCKHCTHAGCLDVCPTGALFRTEFGTVVVQDDVCNGCGTCVAGCPFGVIERRATARHATSRATGRSNPSRGVAQKCTLCYDRLGDDQTPACAQACPTTSIKFGDHDDMVATARERVADAARQGSHRGEALRRERKRRRRRHRIGLPAARRARGLRPAAGPAGADRRPADDVPQGRHGRAGDARHGGRLVPRETPMTTNPLDADRPPEPVAGRATARSARPGRRRRDEAMMVPDVEFESYYGRQRRQGAAVEP